MVSAPELILQHKLLSDSETREVIKKYGVPIEKFPRILSSDPQAVKLEAKAGQLIAISRIDPNAKYVYYRYVVKG